jgi:hypothetical protein
MADRAPAKALILAGARGASFSSCSSLITSYATQSGIDIRVPTLAVLPSLLTAADSHVEPGSITVAAVLDVFERMIESRVQRIKVQISPAEEFPPLDTAHIHTQLAQMLGNSSAEDVIPDKVSAICPGLYMSTADGRF